jgi:hypothetical protein
MTVKEVIRGIGEIGIVPVVRAASFDDATRADEAICAGGVPIDLTEGNWIVWNWCAGRIGFADNASASHGHIPQ